MNCLRTDSRVMYSRLRNKEVYKRCGRAEMRRGGNFGIVVNEVNYNGVVM